MYVVATCGIFVVGVKFDADCITLDDIRRKFAKCCQEIFSLREDELTTVKVESVCDTASVVTALAFMDKFTDECSMVIRRDMTKALKDSIAYVYTEIYKNEMLRKIKKMNEKLFG